MISSLKSIIKSSMTSNTAQKNRRRRRKKKKQQSRKNNQVQSGMESSTSTDTIVISSEVEQLQRVKSNNEKQQQQQQPQQDAKKGTSSTPSMKITSALLDCESSPAMVGDSISTATTVSPSFSSLSSPSSSLSVPHGSYNSSSETPSPLTWPLCTSPTICIIRPGDNFHDDTSSTTNGPNKSNTCLQTCPSTPKNFDQNSRLVETSDEEEAVRSHTDAESLDDLPFSLYDLPSLPISFTHDGEIDEESDYDDSLLGVLTLRWDDPLLDDLPLSDTDRRRYLQLLAESIHRAISSNRLHVLEIDAFPGLDWFVILGIPNQKQYNRQPSYKDDDVLSSSFNDSSLSSHGHSYSSPDYHSASNTSTPLAVRGCLQQLSVRFDSLQSIRDFATALSIKGQSATITNDSLWRVELEYVPQDNDELDHSYNGSSTSLLEQQLLFEGLKGIPEVGLRCGGCSVLLPVQFSPSPSLSSVSLSPQNPQLKWEQLTIEDCHFNDDHDPNAVERFVGMLDSTKATLEELTITGCTVSSNFLESCQERYESFSVRHQRKEEKDNTADSVVSSSLSVSSCSTKNESRRWKKMREIRKSPLKILKLHNNQWESTTSSVCSCASALASWVDWLPNLSALDLSHNSTLFDTSVSSSSSSSQSSRMKELCGTVNQSLQHLSLRNCGLSSEDLQHVASTFGLSLVGLDLSYNPNLMSDLTPLLELQSSSLKELIIENNIC